jgi:hypothetical protein
VKIAPPLTTTREALEEGLAVLAEAVEEAVAAVSNTRSAKNSFPTESPKTVSIAAPQEHGTTRSKD